MDEDGFRRFLIRGGRSTSAVNRCIIFMSEFEDFLLENQNGVSLEEAQGEDLLAFISTMDASSKTKAKKYLWAIRYYYDFIANVQMRDLASNLREERMERNPLLLKEFRGVDPEYIQKLAENGIKNVDQILAAGGTLTGRKILAQSTGIPQSTIQEYVKLSDLARIPGVKGIRARLYYDAGIDTVETIAGLEPDELREIVVDYVARSGFDGLPTLPAEAEFTVEKARNLPSIVEY
jgi:predicted flap endonuclease-1-like 5' DNA nuclease